MSINSIKIAININGNLKYVNGISGPVNGILRPVNGNLCPLKTQQLAVIIDNLLFFEEHRKLLFFSVNYVIVVPL